jgi:hypothetical protein
MSLPLTSDLFPRPMWVMMAVYFVASLLHFAHNAEYIAYYPNLPTWLTREQVYLAWLAVTSLAVAGLVLARARLRLVSLLFIAAYGALGLDGLAHYTLALCSEHTLATNLTIWFEVVSGFVLMMAAALLLARSLAARLATSPLRQTSGMKTVRAETQRPSEGA